MYIRPSLLVDSTYTLVRLSIPQSNRNISDNARTVTNSRTIEVVASDSGRPPIERPSYFLRTCSESALYEASREGDWAWFGCCSSKGADANSTTVHYVNLGSPIHDHLTDYPR